MLLVAWMDGWTDVHVDSWMMLRVQLKQPPLIQTSEWSGLMKSLKGGGKRVGDIGEGPEVSVETQNRCSGREGGGKRG